MACTSTTLDRDLQRRPSTEQLQHDSTPEDDVLQSAAESSPTLALASRDPDSSPGEADNSFDNESPGSNEGGPLEAVAWTTSPNPFHPCGRYRARMANAEQRRSQLQPVEVDLITNATRAVKCHSSPDHNIDIRHRFPRPRSISPYTNSRLEAGRASSALAAARTYP